MDNDVNKKIKWTKNFEMFAIIFFETITFYISIVSDFNSGHWVITWMDAVHTE